MTQIEFSLNTFRHFRCLRENSDCATDDKSFTNHKLYGLSVKYWHSHFSRTDSDVIAKLKGTFTERPKRAGGPGPGESKKKKKKGVEGAIPAPSAAPRLPGSAPTQAAVGGPVIEAPPNQILFLTNLPEETNEMMLQMLFNQVIHLYNAVFLNRAAPPPPVFTFIDL